MNRIGILTCCCVLALTACAQPGRKYQSPAGYDFNAPVTYKMKKSLKEISGIAFYPGLAQKLYAIQDEDGTLFWWDVNNPKELQSLDFGKRGDYEDIGMTRTHVIVLRSDGTLFIFPFAAIASGSLQSVKEWKGLVPEGEYESLYVDGNSGKMIILCKNCEADKGNASAVSGYELQLDASGTPVLGRRFAVNTTGISKLYPKFKAPLKPSALTFNDSTKEWFILASVNKLLIITDQNWNIKQTVPLHHSLFPQPEGITFDIDQNLYISNEAGNTSEGTVLKFSPKAARE